MSSSSGLFNPRTRTAGNITAEIERFVQPISIRNRSNSITKHDDLFINHNLIVEPLENLEEKATNEVMNDENKMMPPRPPEKNKHKKKHRERTVEEKEAAAAIKKERREMKERRRNREQSVSKNTPDETSSAAGAGEENDEHLESLKRITSKHRLRHDSEIGAKNKENNDALAEKTPTTAAISSRRKSNASAKELRVVTNAGENATKSGFNEFMSSSDGVNLSKRRNSFVKMNAFETPDLGQHSPSISSHRPRRNEDEVAVNLDDKELTRVFNLNLINDPYYRPIFDSDTLTFILTPAPKDQMISCKIVCQKGIFTDFFFYIEKLGQESTNLLLMRAIRKVSTAKPTFSIMPVNHTDAVCRSSHTCARFSSNLKKRNFRLDLTNDHLQHLTNDKILDVTFETQPNEPPSITANATLCNGVNGSVKQKKDTINFFMQNLKPKYDPERKKFVLAYNGRAKRTSKHNFQIASEAEPQVGIMQLGKIDSYIFNCDYAYPLCALQAFAFGISSLCR